MSKMVTFAPGVSIAGIQELTTRRVTSEKCSTPAGWLAVAYKRRRGFRDVVKQGIKKRP